MQRFARAQQSMEVQVMAAVPDGDFGARHEANAELQRELLGDLGVRWIDSRPLTQRDHRRDGVHFTRTGYSTWTAGILPELDPATACVACSS